MLNSRATRQHRAGFLPKQAEQLRLFRAIATMNTNAPLPRLPYQTPTWDKAAALARDWELQQLEAGERGALVAVMMAPALSVAVV